MSLLLASQTYLPEKRRIEKLVQWFGSGGGVTDEETSHRLGWQPLDSEVRRLSGMCQVGPKQ